MNNRREKQPPKKTAFKPLFLWLSIFFLAWAAWMFFASRKGGPESIPYSQFRDELSNGNIKSVLIKEKELKGELIEESSISTPEEVIKFKEFKTYLPFEEPELAKELVEKKVEVVSKPSGTWASYLPYVLPWLLLLGFWLLMMRQMTKGSDKVFGFGKSKAKLLSTDRPKVNFDDVSGVEEAKEELKEIIEFLKAPQKFQKLGGKIPKGVLIVGPTGTGKTLLARAVAGEAEVPFLSISGSDFVEMFVGVGAARVRGLFDQAKRHAPCIIFIDEIDAVGRQRGAGLGGGHDEREQTLNQLLVEMDGFETTDGIIIMAATNRPDILDLALLRPGRFDRQIVVDRPDIIGREGILKVHIKKIPLSKEVDLKILARGTPGFSGADLANMVNEAALLAARRNRKEVAMQDFEDAKDKVLMGVERKSLLISEEEKKRIACHEAGHVLVSKMIKGLDPIHKATIIPRGRALGITMSLPIDERRIYPKGYCLNQLAFILGGRAAEFLFLGDLSTGAYDDIEKATALAKKMVCEWGMSEKLGPLALGKKEGEIFLGREFGIRPDFSEKTAQLIDSEVKRFVESQKNRAEKILKENEEKFHLLAEKLLEKEILDGKEIDKILKSKMKERVEEKKSK